MLSGHRTCVLGKPVRNKVFVAAIVPCFTRCQNKGCGYVKKFQYLNIINKALNKRKIIFNSKSRTV